MKKKLLCIVLCLVLVAAAVCALVACDDDAIVVWVGEGTKEFTEQKLKEWNENNQFGVTYKFKVEVVSESKAAGDAISKPQSAADIFCFAQDQLARLVQARALAPIVGTLQSEITALHDAGSVEAATIGSSIRAFPLTSDNGYFMYYDTRVVQQSSIGSLEKIIEDVKNYSQKRNISMNLTKDGGAWYAASFFYATDKDGASLCKSEWTVDDNGKFTDYSDTFNTSNGIIALKGMQKLLQSGCHFDSAEIADLTAGTPSAVVVSGIWSYKAAEKALGSNLGVAPLPAFEVDGETYQMRSYLGSKLMGVKQQEDPYQARYLQDVAMYLTSEAVQKDRFELVGWGPSVAALQDSAAVKESVALNALKTPGRTILQGQYPTNWWAKVVTMTGSAKTAETAAALQVALDTYSSGLNSLKSN